MKKLLHSDYFFLVAVLQQALLFLFVKDDPFFGDAIASTSRAAVYIYEHGLQTIFYPAETDPGHPTLYVYLLACWWKLLGKTLWASHLYAAMWNIFFAYGFYKVCTTLLEKTYANIVFVTAVFFATFLSVSAMMLNTSALMGCFFLSFHALLTRNKKRFTLFASLMMLTHLQSAFFLLSLATAEFVAPLNNKRFNGIEWFKANFWKYAIPFLVFANWLLLHKQHTGWILQSPYFTDTSEINSFMDFVRSILMVVWRLADYGMISCWLVIGYFALRYRKEDRELLMLFTMVACTSLVMAIVLRNTIGHRYFLAFNMLAVLFAARAIINQSKRVQKILWSIIVVSLVAGNFLYYPGKTLGDATLAYRSYFKIEGQLEDHFKSLMFFSHAPLANPGELTHLSRRPLHIERINEVPLNSLPAVIQSNLNAEFTPAQIDTLTSSWYGKSYESGAVYVNVFLNPRFYAKPENAWQLRQPGFIEQRMKEWKEKLK